MNIMGCRDPKRVATLAWSSMNDLALAQLASTHAEKKSFEEALQLRAQRQKDCCDETIRHALDLDTTP